MNRHGAAGTPFLFGVDFELHEGFLVERPLENNALLFTAGEAGNAPPPVAPAVAPRLEILPAGMDAYRRKFDIVRGGLVRGDSFLLNLTERTPIRTDLTLEEIFRHSRARYKLLLPERCVCFSPESFVQLRGDEISTYPMKGTMDASLPDAASRLLNDYKELCEHYTIVDLLRNDLNRIATDVRVKRFRYLEKIRTLRGEILQTSSEIAGTLPADWRARVGDLLFQLLPAGSISGAPKPATLRLIREAEGMPRGFYTGVFGYYDGNTLDSAVMIRYIEQEGDRLYFRSGGGITVNSRADDEYREVLEKIYLSV